MELIFELTYMATELSKSSESYSEGYTIFQWIIAHDTTMSSCSCMEVESPELLTLLLKNRFFSECVCIGLLKIIYKSWIFGFVCLEVAVFGRLNRRRSTNC